MCTSCCQNKIKLGAMTAENDATDPFQIIPIIVNQIGMTKRDEMFVAMEIFIQINEFEVHVDSDPFIIIRRGAASCLSLRRRHHRDSLPLRDNWAVLTVDCLIMREGRTFAETSLCTPRKCCERSPHALW